MAAFDAESGDASQLDFRLMQDGSVNLYFRAHVLAEDVEWLRARGYVIHEFDCLGWHSMDEVHAAFASILNFPHWYGRNLDALNDSLSDVPVPDESGTVLVFL